MALKLALVCWLVTSTLVLSVHELAPIGLRDAYKTSSFDAASCIGPWFVPMTNGSCHCGVSINEAVVYNERTQHVKVRHCYCMTPDSISNQVVVGTCIYTCMTGSIYSDAPTICSSLNRRGTLCGDCMKENDTFPRAYSYDTDCMKCRHPDSWWLYMAEALVPLTAFIFIVMVCRINVVHPQLRVFVFFSQLFSTPINARSAMQFVKHNPSLMDIPVRIYMAIIGIWNLDFFRTLYPGVCLNLSELQVLALDYLVAVYPLIFMVVAYVLVELHGYGCRPLLLIWKPFHPVFARFRREWNIQTTIIDAFVTFFILSTTKFFSVSFDLLIPTKLYLPSGRSPIHGLRLYYNANIVYMGHQHLPYALLALACFGLFVLFPLFILIVSPSARFQNCLRNCNGERRALGEFVHSFQQYYKDGTNEAPDCRWYSGLYLMVFLSIYLTYTFMQDGFMYCMSTISALIFAIIALLVEPYKEEYALYNSLDCVSFLWLALLCLSLTTIHTAQNLQVVFVIPGFLTLVFVSIVPLAYATVIVVHWVWRRMQRRGYCTERQCLEVQLEESLPHRIACSVEYRK